jgi:hypothetical protein
MTMRSNLRLATNQGQAVNATVDASAPEMANTRSPMGATSGAFFEHIFRGDPKQYLYNFINTPTAPGDVMADPTREEIDAKLATVEARTETRFMELSGKMDRIADSIGSLRGEIGDIRSDNKFTLVTIIIAVIGSIIAGLAALWVTQSNMLASFSAGLALHDAANQKPANNQK